MNDLVANLITNKKHTFQHLTALLKQIKTSQEPVSVSTQSILILHLAKFIFITTQQWLKELEKLRYEICYAPLKSEDKKGRNSTAPKKKVRRNVRADKEAEQLSINDILQKMEEKNRNEIEVGAFTPIVTPVKAPLANAMNSSSLRPFQPQVMALISAEISSQPHSMASKDKSFLSGRLEPDLLEYQNMLAFTQKGIDLTTDKKRTTRTRVKTAGKGLMIEDKRIEVSQGDELIRQLELLTTKVKISKGKEVQNGEYFNLEMNRVNPVLVSTDACVDRLRKYKRSAFSFIEGLNQTEMVQQHLFLSAHSQRSEQPFFVNEENNPSLTQQLQEVIEEKIGQQLFLNPSVSLDGFSRKYKARNQIKGELFYQLLHMSFKLQQEQPQHFGDIRISKAIF